MRAEVTGSRFAPSDKHKQRSTMKIDVILAMAFLGCGTVDVGKSPWC